MIFSCHGPGFFKCVIAFSHCVIDMFRHLGGGVQEWARVMSVLLCVFLSPLPYLRDVSYEQPLWLL